jgi:hypothetical protein
MAFGLNIFKTVTANLTTSGGTIYTAPANYSAIVLMAQVSNNGGTTESITAEVNDGATATPLVTAFDIPTQDAAGILTGKLVLEAGYSIDASASANTALTMTLSILESKN